MVTNKKLEELKDYVPEFFRLGYEAVNDLKDIPPLLSDIMNSGVLEYKEIYEVHNFHSDIMFLIDSHTFKTVERIFTEYSPLTKGNDEDVGMVYRAFVNKLNELLALTEEIIKLEKVIYPQTLGRKDAMFLENLDLTVNKVLDFVKLGSSIAQKYPPHIFAGIIEEKAYATQPDGMLTKDFDEAIEDADILNVGRRLVDRLRQMFEGVDEDISSLDIVTGINSFITTHMDDIANAILIAHQKDNYNEEEARIAADEQRADREREEE